MGPRLGALGLAVAPDHTAERALPGPRAPGRGSGRIHGPAPPGQGTRLMQDLEPEPEIRPRPTSGLDDTVHQRHRLGILTITAEAQRAEFGSLRETC